MFWIRIKRNRRMIFVETKVINLIDMVNQTVERKTRDRWDQEAMMKLVMSNPGHQARVKARREEWVKNRENEKRRAIRNIFIRKVGAVCGLCLVAIGLVALGFIL